MRLPRGPVPGGVRRPVPVGDPPPHPAAPTAALAPEAVAAVRAEQVDVAK